MGEDLADLYETAPCGYLSLTPDARVAKLNLTLAEWLGRSSESLVGQPFHALLGFGGRIGFETHLAPLLRMQGFANELALDLLHADGSKLPMIGNAAEKRSATGEHLFTRFTLFKADDRLSYERGLVAALARSEAAIAAEHQTAVLREQFIAVLGHDLRNPLFALTAGVRMLGEREPLSDRGRAILAEMKASVARAVALVEDVLDFARGRLGGGLNVALRPTQSLEPLLTQVTNEIRAIAPGRQIVTRFDITRPVDCDPERMGQLASNLLGNAITHGAQDAPIHFTAETTEYRFTLWVANAGEPIAATARAQLFQPFFRDAVRGSQQGLGLGLFIVNEIAKEHGGMMEVVSNDAETRFTLSMPRITVGTSG